MHTWLIFTPFKEGKLERTPNILDLVEGGPAWISRVWSVNIALGEANLQVPINSVYWRD